MTGHVAGAPVEELLPLLAGGGTMVVVAVDVALRSARRRLRRGRGTVRPSGSGGRGAGHS